jgi:hypothetical protein
MYSNVTPIIIFWEVIKLMDLMCQTFVLLAIFLIQIHAWSSSGFLCCSCVSGAATPKY